jgi:hypothetical protein
MTAAGAAKRAKPRAKNIKIFFMADLVGPAICSDQKQWEKIERKSRCQRYPSGDGEGQGQNYGYLFHGNPLLFSNVQNAKTGQGLPWPSSRFGAFSTSRGSLNIPVNREDFVVRFL